MAKLTPIQQHILHIMSGQSQGYLIAPNAAAFLGAGLEDPEENEKALMALADEGYVELCSDEEDFEEFELIPVESDNEEQRYEKKVVINTEIVQTGWALTDKGKKAIG